MFIKLLSYTGENELQRPLSTLTAYLHQTLFSRVEPYQDVYNINLDHFCVSQSPEKIIKKINEHRYNKQ